MRTTLTIDDDVLAAAKHLAEREHKNVGEVLSSLARQGLARASSPRSQRNGIPLLPGSMKMAPTVTLKLVNWLQDKR